MSLKQVLGLLALGGLVLALAVTDPERPVRGAADRFGTTVAGSSTGALSAAPRRLVLVSLGVAALAAQRERRQSP